MGKLTAEAAIAQMLTIIERNQRTIGIVVDTLGTVTEMCLTLQAQIDLLIRDREDH